MIKPKISIIIPVYNTQKYVRQAVESIMQQTLSDIEIIIINDGSTDDSLQILNELSGIDERIKVYSQENKGQSVSRNAGLEYASGEFVYFMDSDDLLEQNTLELCYNKCISDKLDFVFFDAESFYEEKTINKFDYKRTDNLEDKVYSGLEILNLQLDQSLFKASVCLNIINRQLLNEKKLSFYPQIIHEDELFTFLLYVCSSRAGFLNKAFFKRRVRKNSTMTSTFSWKNIRGYFTVSNELLKFKKESESKTIKKTVDKFLSQMLTAVVWQAHKLPIGQRIKLLYICTTRFRKYISKKALTVMLFKSYLSA